MSSKIRLRGPSFLLSERTSALDPSSTLMDREAIQDLVILVLTIVWPYMNTALVFAEIPLTQLKIVD